MAFHLRPLGNRGELNHMFNSRTKKTSTTARHARRNRSSMDEEFNLEELIMNEIMTKTGAIGGTPDREIKIRIDCRDIQAVNEEGDMIIFTPPKAPWHVHVRGRYPQRGAIAYINTINLNTTIKVGWLQEELLGELGISNTIPTSWATKLAEIEVTELLPAIEVD